MDEAWTRSRNYSGRPGAGAGVPRPRAGWPIATTSARDRLAESIPRFRAEVRPGSLAALFVAALLVALAPLGMAHIPPLADYVFHLARISIIAHWSQWPALHSIYAVESFMLPNIAMDVLMLAAAQVMPVELAGRLFVALTLFLMLSGTVALHLSLYRRFSIWPLVGALFLYNWIFIFGFLNYLFGVGLMLWGLAIWIAMVERPAWQRLLVGILIALAIFFAHMLALGLYGLAVAGFELQRAVPRLRVAPRAALAQLIVAGLALMPPLLLFVALSPTSHEAGAEMKYAPEWYWKGLVLVRTFMSMNPTIDLLTAGLLLLVGLASLWRGRVLIAREMLLALVFLIAAFLILPWKMFGAVFADARVPAALIFVAIASIQLSFDRAWLGRLAYLALGALLLVRSLALSADWAAFDKVYAAFAQAFATLPDHSVILTVTAAPSPSNLQEWFERWRPPLGHAASLAQLQKPVFAANTWATPSQQPITPTPPWEPLYRFQEQGPIPVDSTAELARFMAKGSALIGRASAGAPRPETYLLLLYPSYLHYPLPGNLDHIAGGPRFELFKMTGG